MGPKSILKKSAAPVATEYGNVSNEGSVKSVDPRHLQTALHHATIIQQRKDAEALILRSLEELIDLPSVPASTARRPVEADVVHFQRLIPPFQTSDFDALVEERNAASKCGYVFCPSLVQKGQHEPGNRIDWTSSKTGPLRVIPQGKPETWCSRNCARSAMLVRVQLSDRPAWERVERPPRRILIPRDGDEQALSEKLSNMSLTDSEAGRLQKAMEDLALERGESQSSGKINTVISQGIKEQAPRGEHQPSSSNRPTGEAAAQVIEGYLPDLKG